MVDVRLILGDCMEVMGEIADGSVDAIIADPPYPCIKRSYGTLTEAEWHAMMRRVVAESRRVIKPSGSAVFILQPNSERVGRMRPWLWEFMAWTAREWNQVQDAWWWNFTAIPSGGAPSYGLMRPSVKSCVWLGEPDCFRDAKSVLWSECEKNKAIRTVGRAWPSQQGTNQRVSGVAVSGLKSRDAAGRNGGVTPFNLMPIATGGQRNRSFGHSAPTPIDMTDWWTRYICPPGGTLCDPFMGSGTTGLSALKYGCSYVGIDRDPGYFAVAERRIAAARADAASRLPLSIA